MPSRRPGGPLALGSLHMVFGEAALADHLVTAWKPSGEATLTTDLITAPQVWPKLAKSLKNMLKVWPTVPKSLFFFLKFGPGGPKSLKDLLKVWPRRPQKFKKSFKSVAPEAPKV